MLTGTEVLTTAQMRAIESAAIASGKVTGQTLMERAGAAVTGHIRLRWPKPGRATVLCGPGNNGGDGYVIARLLARAGWQVRVLGMDSPPGPDAAEMRRRWREIGPILPLTEDALNEGPDGDIYVDAIFGIGAIRPLDGEIGAIVARLYSRTGDAHFYASRTVAVDCPSGLCLDSGRPQPLPPGFGVFDSSACLTVTFDSPKPGHLLERGPECCGELIIADIGLEKWRQAQAYGPRQPSGSLKAIWPEFDIPVSRKWTGDARRRARWLIKRETGTDHKFGHGHALVIAGGIGHGGAARLSACAALRAGAGLVTISPPRSALIDHSAPPDALMRRGIDDASALAELLDDKRITAICVGPGCGVDRATALLPAVLAAKRPTVLDADALTALAAMGFDGLHKGCVLTPHMGEFGRLFPDLAERLAGPRAPANLHHSADMRGWASHMAQLQDDQRALAEQSGPAYSKPDAAREAAARCGAVVLLKGPDTVIAAPDSRATIHSAFDIPWLATAGSGDVLAGIIAGLLARGLPPCAAATTGAWLHAAAARRFGPGLIADDLPDELPGVFRDQGI